MNRAGPERGAAAVGYAVMVAIIVLLLAAGVWALSGQIGTTFSDGADCVASPGACEGGGNDDGGGNGSGGGTTSTARTSPPTTGPGPTSTTTGS